MKRHLVGFILISALLLSSGGCLYLMLSSSSSEGRTAAVREGYCPECGRQLPRGAGCPYCLLQKQSKEKQKTAENTSRWSNLSMRSKVAIFVGTSFLNLLIIYWGWFPAKKLLGRKEEPPHRCRCPKCQRKIKYTDAKIGQQAMCPGCHEAFVYPQPDEVSSLK